MADVATKRVGGVPKRAKFPHANCSSRTFSGAPDGATKRMKGAPKRAWRPHANCNNRTFGGCPTAPRNV
eukprot:6787318-Pyramimonas_sp.AAC.2